MTDRVLKGSTLKVIKKLLLNSARLGLEEAARSHEPFGRRSEATVEINMQ